MSWLLSGNPIYVAVTLSCPASPSVLEQLRDSARPTTSVVDRRSGSGGIVEAHIDVADVYCFQNLPTIVGMWTTRKAVKTLRRLPVVKHVAEVHQYADERAYHSILASIDNAISQGVSVINLSLQPLRPYRYDADEAINVGTRCAYERGITVVVAAGNHGSRGDGSLSPWCVPEWVIGVGAASADGKRLWPGSGRGVPGDPLNHPTVVAPGWDLDRVDGVEQYRPRDAKGKPTTLTGTSFAVPHVVGIAANCITRVEMLARHPTAASWLALFRPSTGVPEGAAATPDVVMAMITDMAVPMPDYGRHEVGSGFVDFGVSERYFENFGPADFIRVFGSNARKGRLAR